MVTAVKGQSLVETAIFLPVAIFMLIGVFEVGWALRGYLVLTNANREAARFAVRQNYLDFSSPQPDYGQVWTHTQNSLSGQLDYNETTGAMIVSYLAVEATCTGTITITTPIDVPTYTWRYPITATVQTQIDYVAMGNELGRLQQRHSCAASEAALIPRPNNIIIVEMWYNQKQLLGFPVLSNPFTDPVPMYAHSTFRKIEETRN